MRHHVLATVLLFAMSTSLFASPKDDAVQVVDRWMKAFSASDVEAIVDLYASDAVFMGTGTKSIVTQPQGVRKYFEGALVPGRKFAASLVDSSVAELNDSTVVVTGLDKVSVTAEGRTLDLLGRVTFVLAKRGSAWKIVHFHRSAMPA